MTRRPLDMQNRMWRVPWRRLDATQDYGSQLPRRELLAKEPVTWFTDASGMSKATGTRDMQTGAFHLTLVSIDGNGPTGEVSGVKDPKTNVLTAELKGPGCSNLKLVPMKPVIVQQDNGRG